MNQSTQGTSLLILQDLFQGTHHFHHTRGLLARSPTRQKIAPGHHLAIRAQGGEGAGAGGELHHGVQLLLDLEVNLWDPLGLRDGNYGTPQKSAKTRKECRFEVDFTSKPHPKTTKKTNWRFERDFAGKNPIKTT